ncbi:hypothetical protein [uncultured Chitinophaga sp.]|mgnify:CR=1 FL=1|jgi:hypothetical protein|uniref:hypothetical protein n=1 Tax=uncultured Chitinophaga sp. TaxID=339340 RepID=UPI002629E533|nr:hypothetical protein [uncultured Chitinophaga sp.]
MKNELPHVTATYFIALIKAYLQGVKTKQEIISETSGMLPLPEPENEDPANITHQLIAAATQFNELFYFEIVEQVSQAADTTPTREGLIHHLEAFIAGKITDKDLLTWATTWYNEDEMTEACFEGACVEYCCLFWLPANSTGINIKTMQQVLDIFRLNCGNVLKEKVALVLLTEKEQQHFLFFLRDYADHYKTAEELDIYLLKKFGMDHQSFPYMEELRQVVQKTLTLESLLQKARLIA